MAFTSLDVVGNTTVDIVIGAVTSVSLVLTKYGDTNMTTNEPNKTYYFNVYVGNRVIESKHYPSSAQAETARGDFKTLASP